MPPISTDQLKMLGFLLNFPINPFFQANDRVLWIIFFPRKKNLGYLKKKFRLILIN